MVGAKRRKPVPRNRRPAIKIKHEQYTSLAREIIGTLMAAIIFSASMWMSVFGMTGGVGQSSDAGYVLAGVASDE
jgi:hypothetical protein